MTSALIPSPVHRTPILQRDARRVHQQRAPGALPDWTSGFQSDEALMH